ncbi:MAG: methionyl-tRNA formyltransferase [Acidobacteria bacterium RIFCSPLOWO2_02_FULL_68_18]|nr:MAG: methionyl-tRNA formyltransferase [Acidobacteria bacterium RIFCSPLOWO2_02_FULL_68_18]OFW50270.1 MAG: methionyl-tRNA formyltransferase [Acidobacteria bacterium RIFCSPLOWO2_12_FULL_68_19]
MRIVFFGTPQFAVPSLQKLLASPHSVSGVVTRPDRPRGRGQRVSESPVKALAVAHAAPVTQPDRLDDPGVAQTLRAWKADLGVVAAYGKLIPESLLTLTPHGMINVHASLLPKYRGAAPVQRAVIDGETETGVTIMQMERMLDAGLMLAKVTRPIGPNETADVIERDLAVLGANLLLDVVGQIEAGTVQQERQDFMLCTYAPKVTKEEGLIDWALPATYIHNRVRGLYPWPHAYTYLDAVRLIVLATRVEEGPTGARPGMVVDVTRDAIHVATGHQGRIALEQVQLEGGRPMSVQYFLSGHRVAPGACFAGRPDGASAGSA